MKKLFFVTVVLINFAVSHSFAAKNNCAKYEGQVRYLEAIRAVAAYTMRSFEELCTLPAFWDIEAQPDRVVTRDGEVIPHVTVQLHRPYDSCLYKVRDSDKAITSARCYSGE